MSAIDPNKLVKTKSQLNINSKGKNMRRSKGGIEPLRR